MKCQHCEAPVRGAAVVDDNHVFHTGCVQPYRDKLEGYLWDCPKCEKAGEIDDPSGATKEVEVSLAYGEDPSCAWNGCWGCYWCRNRKKRERRPVRVTCTLCNGRGKLKNEPVPVEQVVDWRLKP